MMLPSRRRRCRPGLEVLNLLMAVFAACVPAGKPGVESSVPEAATATATATAQALRETGFTRVQVLTNPVGQGTFANSLALSDTTLIASTGGSSRDASDAGIWISLVDFFDRNDAGFFVPVFHAETRAPYVWPWSSFATAVATDGPWALIAGAGRFTVFARRDGGWVDQGPFPIDPNLVVSNIAFKNGRGAFLAGSHSSVSLSQLYFWGRSDGGWVSQGVFSTPCSTNYPNCGLAMSEDLTAMNAGKKVTVFRLLDSTWVKEDELTATVSVAAKIGGPVSVARDAIISVAIPGMGWPREVSIHQRQAGAWVQTAALTAGDAGFLVSYYYGNGAVLVDRSATLPLIEALVVSNGALDVYSSQTSWSRDDSVPIAGAPSSLVAAGDTLASKVGQEVFIFEPARRSRLGAVCADHSQCQSGICVDSVCCDASCASQCHGCSSATKGGGLDGVCEPVDAGLDPDNDCTPEPGFPKSCGADGLCDGAGACRVKAGAGTPCGPTQCQGNGVVGFVCDGEGHCVGASAPVGTCAPYVCRDGSCTQACGGEAECAPGARCLDANVCIAQPLCNGHLITDASGAVTDCAPYICRPNGTCADQCTTLADCVSPSLCDRNHRCVVPDAPVPIESAGCGCSGGRPGASMGWLLVAWAFGGRRLRRRAIASSCV